MRVPDRLRPTRWIRVSLALAALAIVVGYARPLGMTSLRALIAVAFADVATVSTAQLAAELATPRRPLLLDARSDAEYAVSHLPGARHAPQADESRLFRELPRDTPIVVYCSVGWRSAGLARRLRAQGLTDVRNLEGSAFAWANEGRPLAGERGALGQVHPWSASVAFLLVPAARGPTR